MLPPNRLRPNEVREGLVLRLEPGVLAEYGAEVTSDQLHRADGPHWFICVGKSGQATSWVATSSRPAPERDRVTRKWGQPAWTMPETWADLYQVWTVGSFFALRAASLGVDPSFPGGRNFALIDAAAEWALAA